MYEHEESAFLIRKMRKFPNDLVWEIVGPDGIPWHRTARRRGQRVAPVSFRTMRDRYERAFDLGRHGRADHQRRTPGGPDA